MFGSAALFSILPDRSASASAFCHDLLLLHRSPFFCFPCQRIRQAAADGLLAISQFWFVCLFDYHWPLSCYVCLLLQVSQASSAQTTACVYLSTSVVSIQGFNGEIRSAISLCCITF